MTQIIRSLKTRCAAAGTNLTEVCRVAGVDRSLPERWKKRLPKSLEVLNALETALNEIEAKQAERDAQIREFVENMTRQ